MNMHSTVPISGTRVRSLATDEVFPRQRWTSRGTVEAIGICAVLMFAPLAFGATEYWGAFILEAASALIFLFWVCRSLASGRFEISRNPLFPPVLLFFVLIAAQAIFGISAYPYATRLEFMRYVAYGMLFVVASQAIRRSSDLRWLAIAFTVFGFLVAAFAIAQEVTSNDKIYWLVKPGLGGHLYGPYVNRNHYAGLMEMLIPFPLVLSLTQLFRGAKRGLFVFAALLMAASVFLSQSRGGIIAFTIGLLFLGLFIYRARRRRELTGGLLAGLVLLAVLVVWFGGTHVLARFDNVSSDLRLSIDGDSLHMFAARPVRGWGLDTFRYAYPQFRSFYASVIVDHAHNDYLQLLTELGLLGFLLMVWFIVLLYRRGLQGLEDWSRRPAAAVRMSALVGCTGILMHSLVDFNLHIPANAAWFYVLCALSTTTAVESSRSSSSRHMDARPRTGEADRSA
jgi:O-antigen ligase